MYQKGVTCQDCHDPHSLSVRAEGNRACASCHLVQKFDTPEHHFHKDGSEAALCVSCHMPSKTYMGVDGRRDHSFRIPRPELARSTGAPNVCTDCHENRTSEWAANAIVEWYGPERPPHYGEALRAGRLGLPSAASMLEDVAKDHDSPGIARATALSLLERYRSPASVSTIQSALLDADPLVRLGALRATLSLEPPDRHRLVFPLLGDDVLSVRVESARALAAVPPEMMTPDQRERVQLGLSEYETAQLVNSDWPEPHLNLGIVHVERGELEQAEAWYRRALRVDPTSTGAYVNLADLYRARGRDDSGETQLREGLSKVPDRAELHHALGLLLVREKRVEEAIDLLGRAAELRSEESRYAYVYAIALQSSDEQREAVRVLERAYERHQHDQEVLLGLVSVYRDAGDARELLTPSPDDPRWQRLVAGLESNR
jgi:Flp pilus assembly protein TadD